MHRAVSPPHTNRFVGGSAEHGVAGGREAEDRQFVPLQDSAVGQLLLPFPEIHHPVRRPAVHNRPGFVDGQRRDGALLAQKRLHEDVFNALAGGLSLPDLDAPVG